jgi:fibronectin type 3 domain-containing protein
LILKEETMTKKNLWLGILVMTLVFGMMVAGCDGEGEEDRLSTPKGLTATALSSNSVQLNWNTVSGAKEYWLERRKGESGSFSEVFTKPTTNSYTDTGLDAETTYYYRVAAQNNNVGLGDYSSPVSVTTNGYSAPSAPTGVTATAVNGSSSSIKVTWNTVTTTESYTVNYEVYYKVYNSADTTTSGLTNATSSYPIGGQTEYTVNNLNALTDYIFYVKATSRSISSSNGLDSDYSATYARATTNVAKPTNVKNSIVNTTTIRVTWDTVPSATSYKVYYKQIEDLFAINNTSISNATLFQTVTATTVDVTGLTDSNVYYFFVVATGTGGDGASEYTMRITWF